MRIQLKLSKNNEIVPFNYRETIVSKLHYWLGKNNLHDYPSLYGFSSLQNGKLTAKGINFLYETSFYISSHDDTVISKIINAIQVNNDFGYGMKIQEIQFVSNPIFDDKPQRFLLNSPVFIKRTIDNKKIHYTFKNDESSILLTESLITKMNFAKIKLDPSLKIYFDKSYPNPKEKLIEYKGIKNKCSLCPIIIEGKPETKQFAYDVGIGNSSGIGFGFLNI